MNLIFRNLSHLATFVCFLLEVMVIPSSPPQVVTVLCSLGVSLCRLLGLSPASLVLSSLCLSSLSLAQGSWSLHTSLSPASSQPLPGLLFSWHLLASFILCTSLSAGIRSLQQRQRRLEKEANIKETNLTKTVQKTLDTFSELKVDILSSEKIKADHKSKEDIEIINVLNSIDKMVNQPAASVRETEPIRDRFSGHVISIDQSEASERETESEATNESDKSSYKERISPLEEFNTLFRNADCVRKSIKLKESHIV